MTRTESQTKQVREWLETGRSLTALDALQLFGCLRLSARIFDLREAGVHVRTDIVEIDGKRVAKYRLTK